MINNNRDVRQRNGFRFNRMFTLAVALLVCMSGLAGCANAPWINVASDRSPNPFGSGDDTVLVEFQRPPAEALADFRTYLEDRRVPILSVRNNTLRTGAARNTFYSGKIRVIAKAKPTSEGSDLLISGEFYNPQSGQWEQISSAQTFTGVSNGRETPAYRAFQAMAGTIVNRYGRDAVRFTDSQLQY